MELHKKVSNNSARWKSELFSAPGDTKESANGTTTNAIEGAFVSAPENALKGDGAIEGAFVSAIEDATEGSSEGTPEVLLRDSYKDAQEGAFEAYLLKPGTCQNNPKPAKTSQNETKRPKTSRKDPPKLRNDPKRPKIPKLVKYRIF